MESIFVELPTFWTAHWNESSNKITCSDFYFYFYFYFGKRFILNYIIVTTMELRDKCWVEMDISPTQRVEAGPVDRVVREKMRLRTPLVNVLEGQCGTQVKASYPLKPHGLHICWLKGLSPALMVGKLGCVPSACASDGWCGYI